jgi:CRP-like cAMP-binding protein
MESILELFRAESNFNEALYTVAKNSIITKTFKKGTILQYKDDQIIKGYFVKKGCLRSYSIDKKGKEHVFMFAPEGWIITDTQSQIQNDGAVLFIDVIEDAEVEIIEKTFFETALASMNNGSTVNIEKFLKRIAVLQKRIIMLMSATAQERYEDFLQTYPDIIKRVPQRMIASYLGITPEALSKIRGEITKKR